MTKAILNEILETMAIHASICNIQRKEGTYKNNFRECPFWSELKGMEMTLKIMGIDFEYEFNRDSTLMTAIKAQGIRKEIA